MGADYTGELAGRIVMRITDKESGIIDGVRIGGTMTDYTLRLLGIPCAATSDTSVGAKCKLFTGVYDPYGIVPEGRRAVWALDQVDLDDGGPDGAASTLDNTPFLTQGIFVP